MDYKEEQDGEVEALKSIYTEEEFNELSSTPWSFEITINSELNDLNAQCVIQFDLPEQYPDQPPQFSLVSLDPSSIPSQSILDLLEEQSNDNIGMPMIFTLTSAVQEKLQDSLQQSLEEEEKQAREKEEEEKRKEEEKYRGTIVTVETFAAWKKSFMEEMNISKKAKDSSRLTGKEMFERDASLALSDVKFITEDEDEALIDDVEVDESLFQDLGDLESEDILDNTS
ncbi:PREDICTED: RWD domain-containing protein 1-like [Amphimedon queenslandica]|uniref:RWD domain-containing protein n=1 Tax=Amphimedon queenslandica TaxID=400682 RepID=A0A1X7VP75_AMPQE|nr:PREDICTED: RWD domain-containing protein 1-like [Amphimedon queenslandica]|eukprot:XP_003383565.1 PREDICTED: RWD domain-containing protein 1-like [Amphimedon queenslandica]